MSESHDIGGELDMAPLPIPSEQRIDVFVVRGCDPAALEKWLDDGGDSNFHHSPDASAEAAVRFCGIALFSSPCDRITRLQWCEVQLFFERAGTEANVFQYCPIRKNFTRRNADWFEGRIL